jgi:hypothetical protein
MREPSQLYIAEEPQNGTDSVLNAIRGRAAPESVIVRLEPGGAIEAAEREQGHLRNRGRHMVVRQGSHAAKSADGTLSPFAAYGVDCLRSGRHHPYDRQIPEMLTIFDNQFWKNAAAKAQPRSDRGCESHHNRFIELCGSQAQNN